MVEEKDKHAVEKENANENGWNDRVYNVYFGNANW
jgi:hypothetical protein